MSRHIESLRWSKFWWQDYDRDPGLRRCSLQAQGFWMRVLCIMADAEPYGRLLVGGSVPTSRELARMVGSGVTERAAAKMMAELHSFGVYSIGPDQVPFCRRMVREQVVRSEAQANGAKGGNPALRKSAPNAAENAAENNENASGRSDLVSGNISGLGDLGVNPQANPLDKLQEERGKSQNSGSLRSPAASAAGEGASPVPEQSAAAPGVDLFGEAAAAAAAAAAEPKRPTAGSVLYGEGMAKLIEMTGRKRDPLAKWIGRMRKEGADDAMILALVQDAHRRWLDPKDELADPVGWISATVKGRLASKTGAQREVPVEAGGWVVKPIVDRCGDLLGADCEGAWPGFSLMLADALAAGADPDRHVYPAMRTAVRKGVRSIESAGWFAFSINGFRAGVAA